VLPTGLKGIVIAGIICIVMSSADSFLNSASVSFVNDILIPLGRAPRTERGQLHTAQVVNLLDPSIVRREPKNVHFA
jgi:SSS family solute:Na+ symporter